jgi:dTDP-4-dehydrorhamnose 3,5-epimerase
MKILAVSSLAIPAVRVIRYGRFADHRGYFTEHFRHADFQNHPELGFLRDQPFVQCNESLSKAGTLRGLHFQWNPYVGKLVRVVAGRLVDLVLDVRIGSPTWGKIVAYDLLAAPERDFGDWIWIPPGFAHGTLFPHGHELSVIEYFCTGQYNPACEASISPLAADIDWSLCDESLHREFERVVDTGPLITDKDRNGFTVSGWASDPRSQQFVLGRL